MSSAGFDDELDLFGCEEAAASLAGRLRAVEPAAPREAPDGGVVLTPPFAARHDRVEGLGGTRTIVVFGTLAAPSSRSLGELMAAARRRFPSEVRLAWRHDPGLEPNDRAVIFALAAEAAAAHDRFWLLTWELLRLHHHNPRDLHGAIVRAGLDAETLIPAMAAGTGADRIAADVASARASGVMYAPTLFIDGERYEGELSEAALVSALGADTPRPSG